MRGVGKNDVTLDGRQLVGKRLEQLKVVAELPADRGKVYFGAWVTLEDEVFCGPSCVFTNVLNPRAFIEVRP